MQTKQPWHWSTAKVLEVLGTRVAMSAMGGKPNPVAARVLERLESSK